MTDALVQPLSSQEPSNVGPSRAPRQRPMPGDGAFLAQLQPGDGGYLQQQHNHQHQHHSRGRGRGGRGAHANVNANANANGMGGGGRGGQRNGHRGGRGGAVPNSHAAHPDGGNAHNGPGRDAPPHRPQAPDSLHGPTFPAPTAPPSNSSTHQGQAPGQRGGRGGGKPGERGHRGRGGRAQSKPRPREDDGSSTPAQADRAEVFDRTNLYQTAGSASALLDPHAPSFQPNHVSAPTSPVIPVPNLASANHGGRTQSEKGKSRPKKQRDPKSRSQPKTPDVAAQTDKPLPANSRSARRAAFEQGAKLTKTISGSSAAGSEAAKPAADSKDKSRGKQTRAPGERRRPATEADDLIDRLTRGLGKRPYFECPICYNSITPSNQIWCCLPPDSPPPADLTPGLDVKDPKIAIAHYQACYTPFHYQCVRDWSKRNLEEETSRLRAIDSDDQPVWRCPGCQKRRADPITPYRCFCGRMTHPPTNTVAPHSCGDICSRKRHTCSHSCPLPCHPGPCPPCQVALVVPCPSHNYPLTVKCHMSSGHTTSMTPVCGIDCEKPLSCGHKDHTCDGPCHYGPCKPCEVVEIVKCYCGSHTKEVTCGWNRDQELLSASKGHDGEIKEWKGRYNCGEPCDRFFDCGVHPCKETCHPHSLEPLVCPYSPSSITTCPCGATPLKQLPGYPRPDCTAPVPTCSQRCPKSRPCGHTCPRTCHEGPCPPCHEEVVRPCRCGESQLVVGCDELRERKEKGLGELTCERVCKALRNCGRHECGRLAKAKGKKRLEGLLIDADEGLHACSLTCGRTLGCGLHTCPKPDHRGACGRCLQASYDELICHCGQTIVYPPVACGTTINCQYPCARPPPPCGHPKTAHPCHEQETCPPCPYLTTRACACGKDQAVKHVRCSQDRVSCGQICGTLLPCGFHTCDKSCHRPGECEPCAQVCSKPKRICRHPCTAQCHAPARCPETDPCQFLVMQTCACGNLQSRTSCGASVSTSSRETNQLKCNSECAIKQRNARLADALGISPSDRSTVEWSADLKVFATHNLAFVKMVESTFKDFFSGQRQTQILPHMPNSKRTFVMALADAYHLGHELIDQEPNRSVQIRRRIDTRVPTPLLSSAVAPPQPSTAAKSGLGNLGNLRSTPPISSTSSPAPTSAWGAKSNATVPASKLNGPTLTPNSSHPSLATLARTQAQAEASGSGPGLGSGVNTPRHSRPVTPSPPVLEVKGKVGEVDEVDWDED